MGCVSVSADVGFTAPSVDSASLCGFQFPPNFMFNVGFNTPAIPTIDITILFPWLSLQCDLSAPFSGGWGGGRVSVYNADSWDDCAPED